jgi:hypothetical protein
VLARRNFGGPGQNASHAGFAVPPEASGPPRPQKIRLREAKNTIASPNFVAIKNRPHRLFCAAYGAFLISPCSD